MSRYSLRLHHLEQWYIHLYRTPEFDEYAADVSHLGTNRGFRFDGTKETIEYLNFWFFGCPAFFNSLKKNDSIDVVHGLDNICLFCPDPIPFCSTSDESNDLLEFCCVDAGKRYCVADLLARFAAYKEHLDSVIFPKTF